MSNAAKISTWLRYALYLLAFSIPTKFIISSVCLAIVAILWLFQGNMGQTLVRIKERKGLWPWFILYALLIISYFYSIDKAQSAFDLKTKLAYIILPIIVGASLDVLNKRTAEWIYAFLIAGVVTAAVISLIDATIVWYPGNYYYAFFYHHLVRSMDPNAVYMAWYTIFSIALLLFMPWKHVFQGRYKILRIITIVFLVIFFFLLSARMFILLFILFIIPYFLKRMFANFTRGVIVTLITITAAYALFQLIDNTNNPIRNRYYSMIYRNSEIAWLDDYSNIEESKFDNVTLRVFLWRIGLESVSEKKAWLTGLGNGDVHVVLKEKMRQYKIQNIDHPDVSKRPGFHNANLHNMFIQTLVMLGIPGIICMILIAILPLFFIFKVQPFQPFLVFHITSILFMMQEAVLQTQAGIFFYILFSSMFWGLYYNDKKVSF